MTNTCDVNCPCCDASMDSSVELVSLDDAMKLDIILTCPDCSHVLNGFLPFDEMFTP